MKYWHWMFHIKFRLQARGLIFISGDWQVDRVVAPGLETTGWDHFNQQSNWSILVAFATFCCRLWDTKSRYFKEDTGSISRVTNIILVPSDSTVPTFILEIEIGWNMIDSTYVIQGSATVSKPSAISRCELSMLWFIFTKPNHIWVRANL